MTQELSVLGWNFCSDGQKHCSLGLKWGIVSLCGSNSLRYDLKYGNFNFWENACCIFFIKDLKMFDHLKIKILITDQQILYSPTKRWLKLCFLNQIGSKNIKKIGWKKYHLYSGSHIGFTLRSLRNIPPSGIGVTVRWEFHVGNTE